MTLVLVLAYFYDLCRMSYPCCGWALAHILLYLSIMTLVLTLTQRLTFTSTSAASQETICGARFFKLSPISTCAVEYMQFMIRFLNRCCATLIYYHALVLPSTSENGGVRHPPKNKLQPGFAMAPCHHAADSTVGTSKGTGRMRSRTLRRHTP